MSYPSRKVLKVAHTLDKLYRPNCLEIVEKSHTLGYYGLGPGDVYVALDDMQNFGHVRSAWSERNSAGRRHMRHELTGTGREVLLCTPNPEFSIWDRICGSVSRYIERRVEK